MKVGVHTDYGEPEIVSCDPNCGSKVKDPPTLFLENSEGRSFLMPVTAFRANRILVSAANLAGFSARESVISVWYRLTPIPARMSVAD